MDTIQRLEAYRQRLLDLANELTDFSLVDKSVSHRNYILAIESVYAAQIELDLIMVKIKASGKQPVVG